MRRFIFIFMFILATPIAGFAQGQIIGVSPSSRDTLDLYAEAGATAAVRSIPTSELRFPLEIRESKSGYHQVAVAGQLFWVRGAFVRMQRQSTAGCVAGSSHSSVSKVISTPGIGDSACK